MEYIRYVSTASYKMALRRIYCNMNRRPLFSGVSASVEPYCTDFSVRGRSVNGGSTRGFLASLKTAHCNVNSQATVVPGTSWRLVLVTHAANQLGFHPPPSPPMYIYILYIYIYIPFTPAPAVFFLYTNPSATASFASPGTVS